jgi:hypothetical protein
MEDNNDETKANMKHTRTGLLWWITGPPKLAELDALPSLSSTCSVDENHEHTSHATAHTNGKRAFEELRTYTDHATLAAAVVSLLLRMIFDRFEFGDEPRAVALLAPFDSITEGDTWPRALEQMLQRGPEGTIRGMLRWFKADIGSSLRRHLLRGMTKMFHVTEPLIIPYVVTSDTLISHVLLHAIYTLSDYLDDPAAFPLNNRDIVMSMVSLCGALMYALLLGATSEDQRRRMMGRYLSQLVPAYEHVLDRCKTHLLRTSSARESELLSENETSFIFLYSAMLQDFPRLKRQTIARDLSPPPHSPWSRLIMRMHNLSRTHACASPECTHVGVGVRLFKYCTGCKCVA